MKTDARCTRTQLILPPDRSGIDARTHPHTHQIPMYDFDDTAPMVPHMTNPTTHTTRTDGGTQQRKQFERPPETTGTEADRHREEIEPGAADLR